MLNEKYKDFFLEAYKASSEHEMDEAAKRDRIVAFYIAVSAFYIGWQPELMKNPLLHFLTWSMWLVLGIVCALAVINLRSWIIQYTNCTEAIGKMFVTDEILDNQQNIAAFLAKHTQKDKDNFSQYIKRLGNILVLGFILISSAPTILLYRFAQQPTYTPIICFLLYCGLLIRQHFISANKARTRPHGLTWIVRFDDIQQVLPVDGEQE